MSKSSFNTIYNIIAKKISGQASEVENKKFDKWLNSSEEAKNTFNDINRVWSKRYFSEEDTELVSQKEVNERLWEKAFGKAGNKKNRSFNGSILIKWAAILVVFLAATVVAYYLVDSDPEVTTQIATINKQTLPGQKSTITLRDGTIVWLNSGSKISYKSNFNDSLRVIELEGQAYFEVFKDKTKPFLVRCRNLEVEALGTSFDVNGYENSSIQVSLLTGSVRLSLPNIEKESGLILYPGEYSVVNNENNFIGKGNFDPYNVLAWKEGRLIFHNATINEIVPKLELWYGVKIHNYSSVNSKKPFTSTFEKENLDNILYNMAKVMNFKYSIKGNNVTIINDMPM